LLGDTIMRTTCPILLVVATSICCSIAPTGAAGFDEVERLSFEEAYRIWVPEQQDHVAKIPVLVSGTTDVKTGTFTPTRYWALTCRLGRDAHNHESFLVSALATNEYVVDILETSSRLCNQYGIKSEAAVWFDPDRGYSSVLIQWRHDPRWRRNLWLKAMHKPASQRDGAANRSQPVHSGTNGTSVTAGFGR
jgi:hypothetical protein